METFHGTLSTELGGVGCIVEGSVEIHPGKVLELVGWKETGGGQMGGVRRVVYIIVLPQL